ncbi:DUF4893 domain-containing protein [Luteimonas aestuarii]|uniref:DUF4893 domain-containing protein n=2 Tax=Luteimonas aestuarii TaxID=453837 RepID=A0A4R5U1R9_9GAMM|nr:DUF4893 domain-containing protein [Luteimonas aestuarii]
MPGDDDAALDSAPVSTAADAEAAAQPRPALPASRCDWQRQALPEHRAQVDVATATLLGRFDQGSTDAQRLAALLERTAREIGDINGAWQVRSLQLHMGEVYVYPYFEARIDTDPCGHRFAKTTGSQRRSGVLYPIEGTPDRLAFLGAATVNEAPPRAYDPGRPVETQFPGDANSAGWLQRIGPDELLMVFDAGPGRFEAYHLRR